MNESADIYALVVAFLVEKGWRREEKVSGWWMKAGTEDMTLGDALEAQLDLDEIDQRVMLAGEPLEFWGNGR